MLGALGFGASTFQQRRFYRTLPTGDLPRDYRPEPGLLPSFGTAIAGIAPAVMLVV